MEGKPSDISLANFGTCKEATKEKSLRPKKKGLSDFYIWCVIRHLLLQ